MITGSQIEARFLVDSTTGVIRNNASGSWYSPHSDRDSGVKKKFRIFGCKTPDEAYEKARTFAMSAHGKFYNPGKHQE